MSRKKKVPERDKKKWTNEEVSILKEMWGEHSIPNIAKKLNRSENSIRVKSFRVGLRDNIRSGDYLLLNDVLKILGINYGKGTNRVINSNIPYKLKASVRQKYRIIYIDDFWKWAEKNKNIINFKNFERGELGPEPEWAEIKRQSDKKKAKEKKNTPWTPSEDKQLIWLLEQYKYGYSDIARIIGRTEGAIKRRCYDLKVKARPIKADNHRKWTNEETNICLTMYSNGSTIEDISERLEGRSALSVIGKIERELHLYDKEVIA